MKRKLHILLAVGIGLTTSVGWLQAKTVEVTDGAGLLKEVAAASEGDTIELAAGNYVLDKQLVISKPIVLLGSISEKGGPASIISADLSAEWPTKPNTTELQNSTANLISIQGKGEGTVTLKNIQVTKSLASGINVQSVMKTVLNNVHSVDNTNAGLLVHSTVEAIGLHTHSNGWGGVNVDKKMTDNPSFKFDKTSFFHEPYKIWTEVTNANVVTVPTDDVLDGDTWRSYTIKASDTEKEKKYWTNSGLEIEYYSIFPQKGWSNGFTFVYADGMPIVIEQSKESPDFIAIKTDDVVILELPKRCNPVIFGGKKNATVANTNITMKSGTISMLFGGGYGEIKGNTTAATEQPAGVTDSTRIVMTGGTVKNSLFGGGLFYNKTKKVNISLSGTASVGASGNWVICGGLESGQTFATAYGDFAQSHNTVETATLNINGGTYSLIGIGGADGDKSYVKNSTAVVKNATITSGVYGNGSNGRSDKVTGTFENCTFVKTTSDPIEIAGVNRGKSEDITLAFNNCTFPSNPKDIYTYLGGTYQWQTNYGGSKVGVPKQVSFTFEGGTNVPTVGVSTGLDEANITVTGAKVSIDSVLVKVDKDKKETWCKEFTLGAGKTWKFNDGLAMSSGVTLTKTGTLTYGKSFEADVKTLAEMKNALEIVNAGTELVANTINLNADLVVPSEDAAWMAAFSGMGYYYQIKKPVTINGNGKSISGTFPANATKKYVITADYNGDKAITINDLTIEKTNATALNITWPKNVILNNVTLNDNEAGGLNINSAKVKATNLQTSGNRAGVRIQHQNATTGTTPSFELVSGTLKDSVQIAFHNRTATTGETGVAVTDYNALVTLPKDGGYLKTWRKAELKAGKEAIVRVWTNSRFATEYINNTEAIQLDSISSGLDSLLIDTNFANVKGVMNTGVKYATFNGKALTASALKKNLIINCEDAYLVTGEEYAAKFAEVAKNKPVKQLTLVENKLAVVSAFSAPVINDEQSWNDAKYAEENVTITKDGILNINVAMALDTIFMEEGAQLKVLANTAVTANAVQLKYAATSNWKALGFPYTIDKVKDAAGTEVKTTAGTFGKEETGFWTANVKADEVAFALTSAAATPASACLIAATRDDKRDSLIYVTSSAVTDVKTIAAPTAPTTADVKSDTPSLAMKANPNLHPTQVMGNVYIYDAAQNVFTQQFNPEVAPFQSYIVADAATTSTLRSLRVGDAPTGNEEITPVEGYYVEAGHGMITIRTAEPVQVIVADMLGRIVYNARVTTDGQQINLPAGIYAVNKQKVIVK